MQKSKTEFTIKDLNKKMTDKLQTLSAYDREMMLACAQEMSKVYQKWNSHNGQPPYKLYGNLAIDIMTPVYVHQILHDVPIEEAVDAVYPAGLFDKS